jgi:DeoR/GlpR family transcriptional regulator of sugar metabolism
MLLAEFGVSEKTPKRDITGLRKQRLVHSVRYLRGESEKAKKNKKGNGNANLTNRRRERAAKKKAWQVVETGPRDPLTELPNPGV